MNISTEKILNHAVIALLIMGAAMAMVNAYAAVIFFAVAAFLHFRRPVGVTVVTVFSWVATAYVIIALLPVLLVFNVFLLSWLVNSGGLILIGTQLVFGAGLLMCLHAMRKLLSNFKRPAELAVNKRRYVVTAIGLVLFVVGCGATYYISTSDGKSRIFHQIESSAKNI